MTYSFMFEDLPMRGQTDVEGGGSKLLFSHPNINGGDPLVIKTGANNVNWGYTLNTKRIPTYGGEVIQVLSMYAESMKVSGQVRNYKEQKHIYDYFRKYLNLAGGMGGTAAKDRNQTPITFSYPARGWMFEIFIVELDEMRLALDVVAPEWGFTAEIASENDRYELGGAILTGMANVLTDTAIVNNSGSGIIGYDPANKYSSDTTGLGNEDFMATIDERLQSQIASWATGDFSHYLFNRIAGENADTSFKPQSEYWTNMFGSDVAFTAGGTAAGGNTGSDTSSLSSMSGVLEPAYVAAIAAEGFKKAGFPNLAKDENWLIEAVRVANGESGWNTQAINWNNSGKKPSPSYSDYLANNLNTVPQKENTAVGNYDLGLWQINNYYHSNDILRANGMSPKSDTADQNKVAKEGLAQSMFDPVLNATTMAYNLGGNAGNWAFWVAHPSNKYHQKGGYESSEALSREAVRKYLANIDKYSGVIASPTVAGDVAYPVPGPKAGEWSGGIANHVPANRKAADVWESTQAVDLTRDTGTPVYAVADGEITTDGFGWVPPHGTVYGARLHLQTKYGYFFYCHMDQKYGPGIQVGAKVKKGQLLGYVGDGSVIGVGSHLHIAMKPPDNIEIFLSEVYNAVTGRGKK